jgi:hypothetical protein
MGTLAGYNLTTGSNNIDIGNQGLAGESGVIRIGTAGTHTNTLFTQTGRLPLQEGDRSGSHSAVWLNG